MDVNHIVDMPFQQVPRGDRGQVALSIDGIESWTWEQFRERRNRFADVLARSGVTHGDRVGMLLGNTLDYVALYFAIARLGAIAVRLNFRLAPSELAFLMDDSGARVMFFDEDRLQALAEIQQDADVAHWYLVGDQSVQTPDWAERPDLEGAGTAEPETARPTGSDPVMIMYTSGTTGRPKGAIWTHDNVMWFASIQIMQWKFDRDSVSLTTGPLYHAGALECFTIPTLLAGGRAVIMSSGGMSATRILETVSGAGVTHSLLYPFLIHDVLTHSDEELRNLETLRLIMSGGDPLQPRILEDIKRRLPRVALNKGYGLTEGGAQSVVLEHHVSSLHPESVGRPLPLTRVKVVDDHGKELPAEEVGEIWVSSPAVSGGYWNRPEATATTFVDGWCRTGDLGRVTDDGYLVISGRDKDMIRSGGENIYPAEVEKVLSSHPQVDSVAVVAIPDPRFVEVGCAVVVPAEGVTSAEELEASLRNLAVEQLAKYKCPKRYRFVEELPVSPSGKILKRKIRQDVAEATAEPPS